MRLCVELSDGSGRKVFLDRNEIAAIEDLPHETDWRSRVTLKCGVVFDVNYCAEEIDKF